jgi:hypothetical protein
MALQDNKTYKHKRQNIQAPSGIRTRDPSNQATSDHALDRATTRIGQIII